MGISRAVALARARLHGETVALVSVADAEFQTPLQAACRRPFAGAAQAERDPEKSGPWPAFHLRCDRSEGDMTALRLLGAFVTRPGDDLDVSIERGQEGHQAIDRVFAEVALE